MANLNEHAGEPHNFSLEQLTGIMRRSKIYTSDDIYLGDAIKLHQRLNDVDQSVKLYEFYLECSRPEMGNNGYIPTDFIETVNDKVGEVRLSVPMSDFLAERWDVSPDFIAHDTGTTYKLTQTPSK